MRTYKEVKNCQKHGLYEAECMEGLFGVTFWTKCPMCEKEEESQDAEEKKQHEIASKNQIMKEANIEREYWDVLDFSCYEPKSPSQQKALDAVKELVEKRHGKIVLLGKNGVGKTMLACIAVYKLRGEIYSMYEISTMIRQSYTNKAVESELDLVERLASIPMLAIDELGRTKGSESELNWLSYIIDKRHVRGLPLMILTNGHFRRDCKQGGCAMCIENLMGNDVLSRLQQDCKFVNMSDAPDYRRGK